MGYDVTRFQGEVDEDLLCPICSGVLEEPVQASPCLKDLPSALTVTRFMFIYVCFFVYIIFSGSTLWTCILQCLHNPVVCPAADLSSWPHGCDARSPAARSPHYAQHALQASDQLRQCWFWLHSYTTTGPAAVTPQGLRAQPQKARQLWGRMRVSDFNSARVIYCETKLLPALILIF